MQEPQEIETQGPLTRFITTNIRFEPPPTPEPVQLPARSPVPQDFDLGLLQPYLSPNEWGLLMNHGTLPVMGSLGMWLLNVHGWCIDPTGRARCVHLGVEVPGGPANGLRFLSVGRERPDTKMLALKLAIESDDRYVNNLAG